MSGHRELFAHLGESGLFAGTALHTIDAHDKSCELDICSRTKHGHRLSNRCSRGGDILDDEHSVSGLRDMTDEYPTLTVVLCLFAVEHEPNVGPACG